MKSLSPTIGVIGGFGPETSAAFCQRIIEQAHAIRSDIPPAFLVDFASVPHAIAQESMNGSPKAAVQLVSVINASIDRLQKAGANIIALPCNTMHLFAEDFSLPAHVTLLHIVDAVLEALQRRNIANIGLLATNLTVSSRLYHDRCEAAGITVSAPSSDEQMTLTRCIAHFVHTGDVLPETSHIFESLFEKFSSSGVSAIVLGCTDLSGMMQRCEIASPMLCLDSFDVLAESCARRAL